MYISACELLCLKDNLNYKLLNCLELKRIIKPLNEKIILDGFNIKILYVLRQKIKYASVSTNVRTISKTK